ncbi:MAG TPA: hypothetical protein VIH18_20310 [Candidatus Binatia bacterium]|jgi:hypothetical protein
MRSGVLAAACFVAFWGSVSAQELTKDQMAYVNSVAAILDDWDNKKIKITKDENLVAQFDTRLKDYAAKQQTNELEQLIPIDFIRKNWDALPEILEPELPKTQGADWALLGSILDSVEEMQRRGIEPDIAKLTEELRLSLYLTLGAAQKEAQAAGEKQIDVVAIRRGGIRFLSLGWPFCCAE